jgi:membrane protease YdiL (CAAX protease family)
VSLPPDCVLDGSWEGPGRRPLVGAIAGLVLCGAVYSVLCGTASGAVAALEMLHDPSWLAAGRLVDVLVEYYRRFQVPILVVTAAGEFAVFFGLVVALVRRWHASRPFRYLSFRRPSAADLALAATGAVAIVPLAELVNRWTYLVLPPLRELEAGEAALLTIRSPFAAVLVVGAVAVTPAICEETLFRGWLMGTLRRGLPRAPALAVQAVLFALFHMSPLSIAALVVVGFYLGWVFELTGALPASMVAHGLYNATLICVTNLEPRWLLGAHGFSLPAIAGSLAAFAAVLALLELRARRRATP